MTRLFVTLLALSAAAAEPAKPPVTFDTRYAFACRDVTPKAFAAADPGRKVMEVCVRISANLDGDEKALDHVVYRLTMPAGVEVADHLPRTELAAEAAGVESQTETAHRRGYVVGCESDSRVCFRLPLLEAGGGSKSSRSAESADETVSSVRHRLLPPKSVILAAGTEARGRTLYFKLRPFSQTTVEGEREFAALLTAPKDWDGDCLTLDCVAVAKETRAAAARQTFKVGLYPSRRPDTRSRWCCVIWRPSSTSWAGR